MFLIVRHLFLGGKQCYLRLLSIKHCSLNLSRFVERAVYNMTKYKPIKPSHLTFGEQLPTSTQA